MKSKFLLIISLAVLLFTACDPNKDIYDNYNNSIKPYSEQINITLVDADYTATKTYNLPFAQNAIDSNAVKAIDTYKSFASTRPADIYVPLFLKKTYIALDSASQATVTYKIDNSYVLLATEVLSTTNNFATVGEADTYIKTNMLTAITNPVEGRKCVVKYKLATVDAKSFYYYAANAWTTPANSYVLVKTDYLGFGSAFATNQNFSATVKPETYLPTFLKLKYPYAKKADEMMVIYDYYSGTATQTHYNKYIFDGTNWNSMETKSSIFVHNGTAWFFDPTVRYLMVKTDYQIIVDYVISNPELALYKDPVFTNNEWYFGASAFYGNYDLRPSKHRTMVPGIYDGKTDSEVTAILLGRIAQSVVIMLTGKFPNAQPFVNGIPVYYEVAFDTYEPNRNKYKVKCKCTDVGKFEFTEGPILLQ